MHLFSSSIFVFYALNEKDSNKISIAGSSVTTSQKFFFSSFSMDHETCEEKLRTRIESGFCYSDFSSSTNSTFHQLENRMQGFEQPNSELFNLQSPSKTVAEASTNFYQPDCPRPDFVIGFSELAPDSAWQENRFQLGSLQSFELRETNHQIDTRFASANSEDGFFGKSMDLPLQQQNFMGSSLQLHHQQLKNSKFLLPTQGLLNEFSDLGIKQKHNSSCSGRTKNKFNKEGDCSKNHSLHSLDFLELQKRKAKLLSMLEEVCNCSIPDIFFFSFLKIYPIKKTCVIFS